MSSPETILAQWREAHREASKAEQALFDASLLYARGNGPKPPEQTVARARELRARARDLLQLAMDRLRPPERMAPDDWRANRVARSARAALRQGQ
ncbi:MAG: hypothetical protein JWQ13_3489 [Ramlibacter sp.]|nr:hypothetical protein [Ramlibacter sp.]